MSIKGPAGFRGDPPGEGAQKSAEIETGHRRFGEASPELIGVAEALPKMVAEWALFDELELAANDE